MAAVTPAESANLQARYDESAPGPYCLSHRSVFCEHAIESIEARTDANMIREIIGKSIRPGTISGEEFSISFPIYPDLCVWEVLTYRAMFHEQLGPVAELASERVHDRHMGVQRIMLGESAGDLAFSLRQNFEDDETVMANIEALKRAPTMVGQSTGVPRCTASGHSMKYQKIINEVLNPRALRDNWDGLRESVFGMMWTFHYHRQCVFCWTKRNLSDAIRVAPDSPVDAPTDTGFDDLVPSSTPRRSGAGPSKY